MGLISRKICRFLCFQVALLHSVPSFFFLNQSPFSSLYTVFNSISSNIDEVLSINPSANVFAFGDAIVYHNKDWLTYSVGTDGPGELCYIFLSQMTSLRWLTFLLGSQTDSLSPALLDLLISSDASICSTMAFPPWGNSDHVVVSVSFDWSNNNGSIDMKLDGSVLEGKSSFKILGLTSSKLDWGSYIMCIAKTASRRLEL